MTILYITSDIKSAGKTALAGALAARLVRSGKTVGYFKPYSTNPEEDLDVRFITANSPPVGNGQLPLLFPEDQPSEQSVKELKRSVDALATSKDMVLVEGPSLLGQDGHPQGISQRLGQALDASVVVMLQYRQDFDVDQVTELCLPFGEHVLGVLINSVPRFKGDGVLANLLPGLESNGVKLLGAIREDRRMRAVTLSQIFVQLNAHWVTGHGKDDDLVESLLIGGNIMDSGATYFGRRDKQLVIVRGDRPDIQLAALSAPPTALVLTGGHDPIEYVYHQANLEDVPILVTERDTLSTAATLESISDQAEVHHPLKLERFGELLKEQADLEAIGAS